MPTQRGPPPRIGQRAPGTCYPALDPPLQTRPKGWLLPASAGRGILIRAPTLVNGAGAIVARPISPIAGDVMDDLHYTTAAEAVREFRAKTLSPVELMKAVID